MFKLFIFKYSLQINKKILLIFDIIVYDVFNDIFDGIDIFIHKLNSVSNLRIFVHFVLYVRHYVINFHLVLIYNGIQSLEICIELRI